MPSPRLERGTPGLRMHPGASFTTTPDDKSHAPQRILALRRGRGSIVVPPRTSQYTSSEQGRSGSPSTGVDGRRKPAPPPCQVLRPPWGQPVVSYAARIWRGYRSGAKTQPRPPKAERRFRAKPNTGVPPNIPAIACQPGYGTARRTINLPEAGSTGAARAIWGGAVKSSQTGSRRDHESCIATSSAPGGVSVPHVGGRAGGCHGLLSERRGDASRGRPQQSRLRGGCWTSRFFDSWPFARLFAQTAFCARHVLCFQ